MPMHTRRYASAPWSRSQMLVFVYFMRRPPFSVWLEAWPEDGRGLTEKADSCQARQYSTERVSACITAGRRSNQVIRKDISNSKN